MTKTPEQVALFKKELMALCSKHGLCVHDMYGDETIVVGYTDMSAYCYADAEYGSEDE